MGGDRSAEFLAPDLSSCKCTGGLNRKKEQRGTYLLWQVAHGHRFWSPTQRKQEWR